ncbi:MAG: hypothetical protein ACTSQA_00485 [Candidatus Heimdallarchaeaceae archaeon]
MRALELFDNEIIVAGGWIESFDIDLKYIEPLEGYFSAQVKLTGTGKVKISYSSSNDGEDFINQSTTVDLISEEFTATSGPKSNGKDVISFSPEPSRFLKLRIEEIGAVNPVTVSATLLAA